MLVEGIVGRIGGETEIKAVVFVPVGIVVHTRTRNRIVHGPPRVPGSIAKFEDHRGRRRGAVAPDRLDPEGAPICRQPCIVACLVGQIRHHKLQGDRGCLCGIGAVLEFLQVGVAVAIQVAGRIRGILGVEAEVLLPAVGHAVTVVVHMLAIGPQVGADDLPIGVTPQAIRIVLGVTAVGRVGAARSVDRQGGRTLRITAAIGLVLVGIEIAVQIERITTGTGTAGVRSTSASVTVSARVTVMAALAVLPARSVAVTVITLFSPATSGMSPATHSTAPPAAPFTTSPPAWRTQATVTLVSSDTPPLTVIKSVTAS